MNALALARLELRPGDHVLEIGFGGGGLLKSILAVPDTSAAGADISPAVLARARRRFAREIAEGRLTLALASAEALPFADGAFDKACSLNSLYFWPDPQGAFAELCRLVRPGGRLVVAFEPPEELRKWPGHEHGFRLWGEDEVAQLMRSAGFDVIEAAWGTGRRPDRFLCLSATRLGANGPA